FMEAYHLAQDTNRAMRDRDAVLPDGYATERMPAVKLLPRGVDFPEFAVRQPLSVTHRGRVEPFTPEQLWQDRMISNIGKMIKGFKVEELERKHWIEVQQWRTYWK